MELGQDELGELLLPYLHLARRSGSLALGHRAVKQSLSKGRCALLLLAKDAGASLRRLEMGDTPLLELADRRTLGAWIGRSELSIVGVTSSELAAGMLAKVAAGPKGREAQEDRNGG
jgi:ribosomal protein L7Ae-like RNA K-turn-binding protein